MSDPPSTLKFQPFTFDSSLHPFDDFPDDTDITNTKDITCRYYTTENISTHEPSLNTCNLSLFHANTRSLNKNSNEIVNYLSTLQHHFSIYGFSETWFRSDDDADLIDIENYAIENCVRHGRRGGGVSLFINSNLNYRLRPDLSLDCADCDSIFIEVSIHSLKTIIGIIYKPEYVIHTDFITQQS